MAARKTKIRPVPRRDPTATIPGLELPDDPPAAPDRSQARPADVAQLWPSSDWPAIDFVQYGHAELPTAAFHLRPGEVVRDAALYLRRLKADLAAGPDGPCAASAIRDCRTLQSLYGRIRPPIIPQQIIAPRPPPKPH